MDRRHRNHGYQAASREDIAAAYRKHLEGRGISDSEIQKILQEDFPEVTALPPVTNSTGGSQ